MVTRLNGPPTLALSSRLGREGILAELAPDTLTALLPSLDWMQAQAGAEILRLGQPSQGMFILVSGRLEVRDGQDRILRLVSPGEPVGEMSLLTDEPHSATVRAVRDSVLVRLSAKAFPGVVQQHPAVLLALSRVLVRRLKRTTAPPRDRRVIALSAASPQAPVEALARGLEAELRRFGGVCLVDRARVDAALGPGVAGAPAHSTSAAHFADFLHDLEAEHEHVLLVADDDPEWAARCIRHADVALLVAAAHRAPGFGRVRSDAGTSLARRELVLVQPLTTSRPVGAAAWRAAVPAEAHHHVRIERSDDLARLARHLAGRSISLVLAGGAVRGFAHVGVLKVLEEQNIPIDLIAGTSIGAVIGSLAAWGLSAAELHREMHRSFVKRSMIDVTVPLVAVMAGRRMERWSREIFGEAAIEDLWRPFRAVSSSLLRAVRVVHRDGLIRVAIRASCSVPGLLPPVVVGDDVLIDGLAMDNLPVDVAQSDTRGRIIAANLVPPAPQAHLTALAKRSALSHLLHMADPRQPDGQAPLFQFLMQANFLSTIEHVEKVRPHVDVFIEPPVGHLGFISSAVFYEAIRLGEASARDALRGFSV